MELMNSVPTDQLPSSVEKEAHPIPMLRRPSSSSGSSSSSNLRGVGIEQGNHPPPPGENALATDASSAPKTNEGKRDSTPGTKIEPLPSPDFMLFPECSTNRWLARGLGQKPDVRPPDLPLGLAPGECTRSYHCDGTVGRCCTSFIRSFACFPNYRESVHNSCKMAKIQSHFVFLFPCFPFRLARLLPLWYAQ